MTGKTHILGGIATATLLMTAGYDTSAVSVSACVLGSLLPDIDHFNSTISNKNAGMKTVSIITSRIFKHRGFIHTPLFIFLLGVFLVFVGRNYSNWLIPLILPITAGMLSHLILDTLNPGGIMWAFPFTKRKLNIANISTGSLMEYAVAILLLGIILMGTFKQVSPAIMEFLLGV